jgi:hypothetical protein
MLLRILLVMIAVFGVISLFHKLSPDAAMRAARRKAAWRIAVRKTAYSLAAAVFLGVGAFTGWHAVRFEDDSAGLVAIGALPLALWLAYLSYRVDRP